ncbi:MAG: GTP pyrophosphokinase [Lachnospiraceae bacterium]|nr:GTP pyrophosphokinase [Lachnospiraceae bacterium]
MIYTDLTKKAMIFSFRAHGSAVDKSGIPYVFHPHHVAESMPDEITTAVALLHDVVEDTKYTFDDLRRAGFPEEVLAPLQLLTHKKGVPYLDYVKNLSADPVARRVKLGDLAHNSDLTRLNSVTEEDLKRIEKYKQARQILLDAENAE